MADVSDYFLVCDAEQMDAERTQALLARGPGALLVLVMNMILIIHFSGFCFEFINNFHFAIL